MALRVLPHFYQTWPFRFLIAGLVVMAGVLGVRWRTNALRDRAERLRLMVEESTRELATANDELARLASVDGLTGTVNRRRFDELLPSECSRAKRDNTPLSLIMIDIDYFKKFNDTYGHQGGDECLRRVASTLQRAVGRPADVVARYGGEEFAILAPNTPEKGAMILANNVLSVIQAERIPHAASEVAEFVTLSMGVATFDGASDIDPGELADRALYRAKREGRSRAVASVGFWRPGSSPDSEVATLHANDSAESVRMIS